eukprot:COSAG01_NODE_4267_length_5196_cov_45.387875_2_plen_45_part_00
MDNSHRFPILSLVLISFNYNLGLTIKPIKGPRGGYLLVLTMKCH